VKFNHVTEKLNELLRQRILVMDGAMGTMIQQKGLTAQDFGGPEYEGCNEYLNLTRPDVIASIHEAYLGAGADIVETNTFGGTSIVLAEYNLQHKVHEINRAGAQMARQAADRFSTSDRPRFVAGAMGPTTKTITVTGGVTFDQLVEAFEAQTRGLIEGGSDLLLLETTQDTLNLKAAAIGVAQAQQALGTQLPVMVSGTIEPMGTMLAGQGVEALYTSLEHLSLFSIGLNCATGPEFMTDHLRSLASMARCWVSVYPNAGLPDEDGKYAETPQTLSAKLSRFVEEGWVNIVGGCCGTTPAHISAVAEMVKGRKPRVPKSTKRLAISGIDFLAIEDDIRPVLVGERTNQTGSRKFRQLIEAEQFEEGAEVGRAQVKNAAHILDVNMDSTQRDNVADMDRFLKILTRMVKVPIMIDSTNPAVIEAGLKDCQGKCVINSINLEDGEERFEKVVPFLKKYGGAVVVGCIDEQGQAISRQRKLEVAQRSYDLLVQKYGLHPTDLIFDALVFPTASGDKNYDGSAPETLEAIRMMKEAFPECRTILGISNVSFGLPPAGREVLNSVFLYHAVKGGLDFAIVNAEKLERYPSIPEEERKLCEDLLFWRGDDPVAAFANAFRDKKGKEKKSRKDMPLDERLAHYIIEGSKEGLIDDLNEALQTRKPLVIINGPLMAGMDEVGRLFNNNELIVAEVLQSAEAMKAAVRHLEQFMEKSDANNRGKIVLATVKGDVHDIGKNLVEIILSNNGYRVINLGIRVLPEELIKVYQQEKPNAIGLSGLLVKSAQQMVLTVQDFRSAGMKVPVLVGGAALTKKFAGTRIAPEYPGPVLYAKDAMEGLDLVNQITNENARESLLTKVRLEQQAMQSSTSKPVKAALEAVPGVGSKVRRDYSVPKPPDDDLHILRNVDLRQVFAYINPTMLYGKHLGLRGTFEHLLASGDEKAAKLKGQVEALQNEIIAQGLMQANAIYRFYSCQSRGEDLIIYDPEDRRRVIETFTFPRQLSGERLCLSDYSRDLASGEMDAVAIFVVSCGNGIRELSETWKGAGEYLRCHLLQAIAIEGVEAFAEWLHKKIRADWGFADPPEMTIRDVLKNKYRGIRVSFGYPACPDLADQRKLFKLLNPSQIGVELTEGDMMDPEASVSALIFHHPDAKYFRTDVG
jgi:5-methyltetrahydrofolate--homocysteine methyltransferase